MRRTPDTSQHRLFFTDDQHFDTIGALGNPKIIMPNTDRCPAVCPVNNFEQKTGNVDAEFKESAVKRLKNGENTLAITTRHNWRWDMLFMKVYNDGFGFRLDARKK